MKKAGDPTFTCSRQTCCQSHQQMYLYANFIDHLETTRIFTLTYTCLIEIITEKILNSLEIIKFVDVLTKVVCLS